MSKYKTVKISSSNPDSLVLFNTPDSLPLLKNFYDYHHNSHTGVMSKDNNKVYDFNRFSPNISTGQFFINNNDGSFPITYPFTAESRSIQNQDKKKTLAGHSERFNMYDIYNHVIANNKDLKSIYLPPNELANKQDEALLKFSNSEIVKQYKDFVEEAFPRLSYENQGNQISGKPLVKILSQRAPCNTENNGISCSKWLESALPKNSIYGYIADNEDNTVSVKDQAINILRQNNQDYLMQNRERISFLKNKQEEEARKAIREKASSAANDQLKALTGFLRSVDYVMPNNIPAVNQQPLHLTEGSDANLKKSLHDFNQAFKDNPRPHGTLFDYFSVKQQDKDISPVQRQQIYDELKQSQSIEPIYNICNSQSNILGQLYNENARTFATNPSSIMQQQSYQYQPTSEYDPNQQLDFYNNPYKSLLVPQQQQFNQTTNNSLLQRMVHPRYQSTHMEEEEQSQQSNRDNSVQYQQPSYYSQQQQQQDHFFPNFFSQQQQGYQPQQIQQGYSLNQQQQQLQNPYPYNQFQQHLQQQGQQNLNNQQGQNQQQSPTNLALPYFLR